MIGSSFIQTIRTTDAPVSDVDLLADGLGFSVPPELEAHVPPEARGLTRDGVRLLVSYRYGDRIVDARFSELSKFLNAGDVLVLNTSGTMNAALSAIRSDGTRLELHLSTHLPSDEWTVELRSIADKGSVPFYDVRPGETFLLPAGASVTVHAPYSSSAHPPDRTRLWIATLTLPMRVEEFLDRYGFPIRYGYVWGEWPLDYYQTVYATDKGSAEMASAGRPFTPTLMTQLVARGVLFAPLLLHAGVASLESNEPPYAEFYRVSSETAYLVNSAKPRHKRVIAVGTTAVRALETATDEEGTTHAGEGWTRLVVTPARGIRAVDGLLTGFHEPRSTHLAMLQAIAGRQHVEKAYAAAIERQYLWHEFGDLHLILP